MDNKRKDRIDRTLEALDGLEQAGAGDRFYRQLEARLQEEGAGRKPVPPLLSWAAAAVVLIFILNIVSLLQIGRTSGQEQLDNEEGIELMIEEYSLDRSLIYTINGEE